MKKFSLFCLLAVMLLPFSCRNSRADRFHRDVTCLRERLSALQNRLPLDLGDGFSLTDAVYDEKENVLQFSYAGDGWAPAAEEDRARLEAAVAAALPSCLDPSFEPVYTRLAPRVRICWSGAPPKVLPANPAKIALVLGGGGAKGAATVGALKELELMGVKADCVAGTSIGALVGGLYSAGYTADELYDIFKDQAWKSVWDLLFNNKMEETKVKQLLRSKLSAKGCATFGDLVRTTGITFRCVAAEFGSTRPVVFSDGDLVDAMYASMAVPLVFSALEKDGRVLNDGGLLDNLPVDVARDMGADVIVAVDLQQGQGSSLGFAPGDLLSLGGLVDWFCSRPDADIYWDNLRDVDVYIHPDLAIYDEGLLRGVKQELQSADFTSGSVQEMYVRGREEALKHREELLLLVPVETDRSRWQRMARTLTGAAAVAPCPAESLPDLASLARQSCSDPETALRELSVAIASYAGRDNPDLRQMQEILQALSDMVSFFERPFFSCRSLVVQGTHFAEGAAWTYPSVRKTWEAAFADRLAAMAEKERDDIGGEAFAPLLQLDAEHCFLEEEGDHPELINALRQHTVTTTRDSLGEPVRAEGEPSVTCEGVFTVTRDLRVHTKKQKIRIRGRFALSEEGFWEYQTVDQEVLSSDTDWHLPEL